MERDKKKELDVVIESQNEPKNKEEDVQMENRKKEGQPVETANHKGKGKDAEMEELKNIDEDIGTESGDTFSDDSDSNPASTSDDDDNVDERDPEAPLTDVEIEELVAEFLEVESKSAEAQESLEKESLARVESEVRSELAERLQGDELEMAVSSEMETFIENWEASLDDLEKQSALLLEQLDGAGIELPSLYRWIESQVPNGCCTQAWKERAHWVGSQVTSELSESVRDAETFLQSCRPVRRQHGKLLEEGASGYLAKKLSIKEKSKLTENSEKDWSSFNELVQSHTCSESISFGSKNWASVYLASTPQQAAKLGLEFPGVDEVEEIGEVECNLGDPFYADAIANEKEIDLSEEQRRNFRKVREEDDADITKKLQDNLKRQRQRNRKYLEPVAEKLSDVEVPLPSSENGVEGGNDSVKNSSSDMDVSDENNEGIPFVNGTCKRLHDNKDTEAGNKRCRTVIIDSDDEVQVLEDKCTLTASNIPTKDQDPLLHAKKLIDVIDVDFLPSPSKQDYCTNEENKGYNCTACSEALKVTEVRKHPSLEVIICESCKLVVEEKFRFEDPVTSRFCVWCGKSINLISCSSCEMLFCAICVTRNFGKKRALQAQTVGWECCCCLPNLLHQFIVDCEKAIGDISMCVSASDSELSNAEMEFPIRNRRRRKQKIRRILDDTELGEETKEKIAIEKARQEHIKSMQEQSAVKAWSKSMARVNENAKEGAPVEILGDVAEGYIVNVAREEEEEPIRIPPSISAKLKPHQVAGIRFMWENIIQSVRKVKSGDKGLGCILAHTMGLGKTFQVITFLYAAFRGAELGLKTAIIVTPVNVLHNWRQEFSRWKPLEYKSLRVVMLEDVSRDRRAYLLAKWRTKGGVLLIGYAAFRNLSLGRHVKDKTTANEISHALQYGADILVCDEAHMIKNTKADITLALKQVKTQRRIALTGSPLQNNLMEYYCMVDFVREGFLGRTPEFRNRFQNPIEIGQLKNSTSQDVKIMNQRSHILYEQLKGFVQRMNMNVVKKDLPPKTVFVITVKLSPLQKKLYKRYLDMHGFVSDKISSEGTSRQTGLFAAYQALSQIWNHPGLLQMAKEHKDHIRREDAIENFIADDSSSDDNMEQGELNGEKQRIVENGLPKKNDGTLHHEEIDWWNDLLEEKIYKEVDYSGKMVLVLDILSMSSEVGDKVLIFSQSLLTLDLIEMFLSKFPAKGRPGKFWKQGKDWYRLDGSTDGSERQKLVERFNESTNTRVKCMLISTRAGSLGINLQAANRVILVDGSWNPTYDLQAINRVWRYGQNKPVYAYRLMAHRTMEEKIYKRQVTKEGLSARVVDRQQIHRTMSKEEMLHLFDFGDDETALTKEVEEGQVSSDQDQSVDVGRLSEKKPLPPLLLCARSSDKFMENLLSRHFPRWIMTYHEHETLLQENEAERLTKEEKDMAWQTYKQSIEWEVTKRTSFEDQERKPTPMPMPTPIAPNPEANAPQVQQQAKGSSKSRPPVHHQRKCTNLAHLLTLRSQGTKSGGSTVCGECSEEISWVNLNRDGKSR